MDSLCVILGFSFLQRVITVVLDETAGAICIAVLTFLAFITDNLKTDVRLILS